MYKDEIIICTKSCVGSLKVENFTVDKHVRI